MDDQNFEDIVREDVDKEMGCHIYKCIKIYGLEGCLEKIETLYLNMPELKERWLTHYWKIVKG